MVTMEEQWVLASAALALPTTPSFSLGTDVTKLIPSQSVLSSSCCFFSNINCALSTQTHQDLGLSLQGTAGLSLCPGIHHGRMWWNIGQLLATRPQGAELLGPFWDKEKKLVNYMQERCIPKFLILKSC